MRLDKINLLPKHGVHVACTLNVIGS